MFSVVSILLLFLSQHLPPVTPTVQITPFTLADSVVITKEANICIPKSYYFLRGRFRYGVVVSKLTWMLDSILAEMGKYGSAYESDEMKAKRICAETEKEGPKKLCKITSVIPLTGEAKSLRHLILAETDKIQYEIGRIVSLWNIFPNEYKPPDPAYTAETIENKTAWTSEEYPDSSNFPSQDRANDQAQLAVYFPFLNDKLVAALEIVPFFFNLQNRRINVPFSDNKVGDPSNDHQFIGSLVTIHLSVEQAHHMLQKIHHTTLDLMKGQFPEELFPVNTWIYHWYNIPISNLKDSDKNKLERISSMVRGLPLTMARKTDCDPVYVPRHLNESCTLDVVTMIPDLETLLEYEEKKLTPHPVKNEKGKWIKVKIPDSFVVQDIKKRKEYLTTTRRALHCFKDDHISPCHMCTSDTALKKLTDECVRAIIAKNVTREICETEETSPDSFQRIPKVTIVTQAPPTDDNIPTTTEKLTAEIILSNDQPSAIIEKCPGQDEVSHELPHSAKVAISEKCKISFVNPPKVIEVIPGQDFPHIPIPTHKSFAHETGLEHNYKMLKVHFHEHGYIYILVSSSSIGLIIIINLTFAICRRIRKSHKRRREREVVSLLARTNNSRVVAIPRQPTISEVEE